MPSCDESGFWGEVKFDVEDHMTFYVLVSDSRLLFFFIQDLEGKLYVGHFFIYCFSPEFCARFFVYSDSFINRFRESDSIFMGLFPIPG